MPKDEQKAAYWLGKAADAGLTNAELEYGIALYLGKGVKKDEAAGFNMLRRAAEKGNPVAQNRLAHALRRRQRHQESTLSLPANGTCSRANRASAISASTLHAAVTAEERTAAEKAAYDWQQQRRVA